MILVKHILKRTILPILFILMGNSAFCQVDSLQVMSSLVNRESVSSEFINSTYHHYTLDHFVSNYFGFTYSQINTMSDFSIPDPYVYSLVGHNFTWNKFYYEGHRINDALFPGTSLYKPLLYNMDLSFDLTRAETHFLRTDEAEEKLIIHYSGGRMGEKVPWYEEYVNTLQGHNSAFHLTYQPIELRKHLNNLGTLYLFKNLKVKDKEIPLVAQGHFGSRDQIRFTYNGIDNLYTERFGNFLLSTRIPLKNEALFDELNALAGFQYRENLFSEFYYDKSETSSYTQAALSVWGDRNRNGRELNLGMNLSLQSLDKTDPNFVRNMIDQDGEGMEPWYPEANIFQLNINHRNKIPLSAKGFSFRAATNNTIIEHNPKEDAFSNAVYFQTVDTPFTPLYATNWTSSDFATLLLENEANLVYEKTNANGKLSFLAEGGFSFDGFLLSNKSFAKIVPQFRSILSYKIRNSHLLTLDIGRSRIPFNFNQVRFLSDKYLSGNSYYWSDSNGDQIFQSGEENGLYTTTGGQFHYLGSNLKQPSTYFIDLSWDWRISKNWLFTITNQFRSFRNLWTVEYDLDTASIGYFESFRDKEIFFLNGGQTVNYRVVNFKPETLAMNSDSNADFPFDHPFYAGSTMKLSREGKRLFLSVSFSAYMIVGYGPTGNGPLHNSPGVLSEKLANPNNYINHVGRYDSDRAYIVRTLFGWKFSKSFSASLLILFKDGQPISTFETRMASNGGQNQVATWNYTNKGISPYSGQFGFREGAYWNYELKMKYDLKSRGVPFAVNFYVYNIMDIATLLNNYSYSPYTNYSSPIPFISKQGYTPNRRSGMEVQIPRGFMIGLNYYFQ